MSLRVPSLMLGRAKVSFAGKARAKAPLLLCPRRTRRAESKPGHGVRPPCQKDCIVALWGPSPMLGRAESKPGHGVRPLCWKGKIVLLRGPSLMLGRAKALFSGKARAKAPTMVLSQTGRSDRAESKPGHGGRPPCRKGNIVSLQVPSLMLGRAKASFSGKARAKAPTMVLSQAGRSEQAESKPGHGVRPLWSLH